MKPRLLVTVALAAGLAFSTAVAATTRLQDAATGATVSVEPGAPALHLVFFATWCPTCLEELESLRDLEARWKDRGYQLVVIAVPTRQTLERLTEFAGEQRLPGRLLFDASGEAEKRWKPSHLPTHLVLDRAGTEIVRANALDEQVEQAIEGLLAPRNRGAQGP